MIIFNENDFLTWYFSNISLFHSFISLCLYTWSCHKCCEFVQDGDPAGVTTMPRAHRLWHSFPVGNKGCQGIPAACSTRSVEVTMTPGDFVHVLCH